MPRVLTVLLMLVTLGACARSETRAPEASGSSATGAGADSTIGSAPVGGEPEVRLTDAPGLLTAVRQGKAPVTLVNVWATWCGPCREEFPDLVRLERDYRDRGLRVLFVSADFDDQLPEVKQFLAKHGVAQPSYLKTGDDMQFIDLLDERWTGALPATFIYDGAGRLRAFREGKASYAYFEREVRAVLDHSQPPVSAKEDPS